MGVLEEHRKDKEEQEKEMIEQEIDGMWAVDGFSEPLTDFDFSSKQPLTNDESPAINVE